MSDIEIERLLSNLANKIEAKKLDVPSNTNLSEAKWAEVDSYNKGLAVAAEIVRAEIKL